MLSPILALSLSLALAQNPPAPAAKAPAPVANAKSASTSSPTAAPSPSPAAESKAGIVIGQNGLPKIFPKTGPCVEVSHKFCEGVGVSDGKLNSCLMKHKAELPAACIERLEFMEARAKATSESCKAESRKICGNLKAGDLYTECLKANAAKFSEECRKKDKEFRDAYFLEHHKGQKKSNFPPQAPAKMMTDPALTKPPPPPPQEPPPAGYVPPQPKQNAVKLGAKRPAQKVGAPAAPGQTPAATPAPPKE